MVVPAVGFRKAPDGKLMAGVSITASLLALFVVGGLLLRVRGDIWVSSKVLVLYLVIWFICCVLLLLLNAMINLIPVGAVSSKFFGVACVLIGVSWAVVWLAVWPGYYAYDTSAFVNYINNEIITSHQSVFHTLVVSTIISVGNTIFGSYNSGVALYIGLQAVVLYLAVIGILSFLNKQKCGKIVFAMASAFYALCPSILVFVFCSTKDVMFAACLVYLCMQYYLIVKFKEFSVKRIGAAVFFSILTCLYRNNGVYVLLGLFILLLFYCLLKKAHLVLCFPVVLGIVASMIWSGPIQNAMGVEKNNSVREMISIPAVQMARSCSVDSENMKYFNSFGIDCSVLGQRYKVSPQNTDHTRNFFWDMVQNGEYKELVNLYLQTGMSHKHEYIVAPLVLTEASWSPFAFPRGYNNQFSNEFEYSSTDTSVFAAVVEPPARSESKIPWLRDLLWHWSRDNPLRTYLPVAWTASVSFFVWILLVAFLEASVVFVG